VKASAKRIVSLLPSATEWISALGFGKQLVGVSHECDYPAEVASLPRVTSSRIKSDQTSRQIDDEVRRNLETQMALYSLNEDLLAELRPDLIVTQSLCNVCAVDHRAVDRIVSDWDCVVLDLHAVTFEQVLADAEVISNAVGSTAESRLAFESLSTRAGRVRENSASRQTRRPNVTLLEWTDPLFCSGHWTPQLIQWAGGIDPIGVTGQPSREITFATLQQADPDLLLVACCGMDLDRTTAEWNALRRDTAWSKLRCVETEQVYSFDGSAYFNRSGPRLVESLEQVAALIERWPGRLG
jgi:iron complex transport system substrate-binding protein